VTQVWIPNLAGVATLTPIRVTNRYLNTGAGPDNIEYTVPAGRLAVITAASISRVGGTAYTRLVVKVLLGGVQPDPALIEDAEPVAFGALTWSGHVPLIASDQVRSEAPGGDATSDYQAAVFGFEFDWIDDT
jgi:hypothetical protein